MKVKDTAVYPTAQIPSSIKMERWKCRLWEFNVGRGRCQVKGEEGKNHGLAVECGTSKLALTNQGKPW